MAPSANRRSGNSRRAQYTTFFSYVAGGAGAAVGAVLLVVSFIDPDFFSGLRGLGSEVAGPASRTAAAGKATSSGLLDRIGDYFAAGSQNAQLRKELSAAKVRLVEADAQAAENKRLKALLGLMDVDPKPIVAARLIGSTSSSTRRFATLDAGSSDGVTVGMPVRSPIGVIGRVLEVAPSTSRLLLVTDTESVVPVRRSKDDVAGFAQGRGDGTIQVRLINLGINPLKKGDIFVTSGSGGLYRPGIPVAMVTQVTSDGAIARLLSDPGSTDYVVVDPVWARDSLPQEQAAGSGTTRP